MGRQQGGASLSDHYASLARQLGRKPPPPPLLPPQAAFVWDTFMDLHQTRGATQFGPLPVSYAEIAARQQLLGERLRPWEVQALRILDEIWLSETAGPATATDATAK